MQDKTEVQSDTISKAVEGIRYFSGIGDEQTAHDHAVAVHQAIDVEGIGVRELSRQAKAAGATRSSLGFVSYIAAAGAILEAMPEAWIVTRFANVLAVTQFTKTVGRPAVMEALAAETDETAWRDLCRLADATADTGEDKGKGKGKTKTTTAPESPAALWAHATAAIEAALEATKADSGKGLTLDLCDAVADAGALMIKALEITDTVRANLTAAEDKTVGSARGRGDIVPAGK